MQKKIIALAVAGLMSGAALAQSNVTVHGQMDLGYTNAKGDGVASGTGNKKQGINSGLWASSRLGFKGEEALGGGMKATFALEYGLDADSNQGVGTTAVTTVGNAREQTVGLAGSWGMFKVGRQTTLGHNVINNFDATRATVFSPLSNFRSTTLSNSSRVNNAITYVSPNMSGFTLAAMYAYDGTALSGTVNDQQAYGNSAPVGGGTVAGAADQEKIGGISVEYKNGPFAAGFVHHTISHITRTADSNKESLIGASYDFGMAKVFGTWQSDKRDSSVTDRRIAAVGAQIPVNAMSRVDVSYADANDKLAANADSKSWGLQYSYDMSKRTMLFGGYTNVDNKTGATFSALRGSSTITGAPGLGVIPAAGQDSSGWGFGMRHSF